MITTAEEFCRLRESEIPEEYGRAAHEDAPLEVWRLIIETKPEMRVWVAQNTTVPLGILEELAGDSDVRVRHMVAMKRKISEAIAVRLARDEDDGVRAALARNAKLPDAALAILRADRTPLIQEALACRERNG